MIAHRLIEDATAAGLSIVVENGDLVVEADCDPPSELIEELRRYKPELLAALSRAAVPVRRRDIAEERGAVTTAPDPPAITPATEAEEGAATADQTWWRDQYEERAAIRQYDGGYPRAEAELLAWREMETRWHATHGERVPRDVCAGCRRAIGDAEALDLIDGCRVHIADGHNCLIRHGERWHNEATAGLRALGLDPPPGFELL
jgi:hypothetical protein